MNQLKQRLSPRQILHTLTVLLLAVVFCVFSSDAIYGRRAFYLPKTINVNGTEVVVNDDLARNQFASSDFTRKDGRMTSTTSAYRTGIDVSAHQGKINWKKVAQDGIDFAMLRAGVRGYGAAGTIKEDEYFQRNAKQATKYGIDIGVYFFSQATTVEEAIEEADFLLDTIEGVDLTLPVAYDWENIHPDLSGGEGARTDEVDMETVTACALAFCQRIEEAGYTTVIYCNDYTGYFFYDLSQLQDYPIWYAAYGKEYPNYYYALDIWQYTDSGQVAGIEGSVDMNIWMIETDPADKNGNPGGEGSQSSGSYDTSK
jgi:GH25 family lysozyme M1 (1,4-beta-N-acetylmuramidase)